MTEFAKYFTTTTKGGYSNCEDRGNGNVLPNCVGLCWGLFFYMHGQRGKNFSMRPRGDANTIYNNCKKNGSGFWVSKAVKENAIACYNIGSAGHVVYILYKMATGQYLCIESNYSGTIANGKYCRTLITSNPATLYKGYQGCVYDFT